MTSVTLVQESASHHLRGRVKWIMSFKNLWTGCLADRYGVVPLLGIPAVLFHGGGRGSPAGFKLSLTRSQQRGDVELGHLQHCPHRASGALRVGITQKLG